MALIQLQTGSTGTSVSNSNTSTDPNASILKTNRIIHQILGPTTIHLQHELSLVITLAILTTASLLSLYRTSFGTIGDYHYLLLTTFWLSRHFFHRVMCTTDVGSTSNISTGVAATSNCGSSLLWKCKGFYRCWIRLLSAGQYCDTSGFTWTTTPGMLLDPVVVGEDHHHHQGRVRSSIVGGSSILKDNSTSNSDGGSGGIAITNNSRLGCYAGAGGAFVPFHRIWIVSKLIIAPIVILVSLGKYALMKLSSRRRVVYHHNHQNNQDGYTQQQQGGHLYDSSTSNNDEFNDRGEAYYTSGIPDDEHFFQIYHQFQVDLNQRLDILWEQLPQGQMVVFYLSLLVCLWFCMYTLKLSKKKITTFSGVYRGFSSQSMYPTMGINGLGGAVRSRNGVFGWIWNGISSRLNSMSTFTTRSSLKRGYDVYMSMIGQYSQRAGSTPHAYKHTREQIFLNNDLMAQRFEKSRGAFSDDGFFYGKWGVLCMLAIWGTLPSLLLYGRILLPIPDLAKQGGGLGQGKIGGKSSKHLKTEKPWSDCYKSISSEDRFLLHFKIIALRIIENLILCAILPQTEYICKVTGHCKKETMLFELRGIAGTTGSQGQRMFENLIKDDFAAYLIAFCVISVTVLILLSQAATLDRGFLARKGYMKSEHGGENDAGNSGNNGFTGGNGGPDRGKRSSLKKANSNSISTAGTANDDFFLDLATQNEGGPSLFAFYHSFVEKLCHLAHETFAVEVGALTTSHIIAMCSHVHLLITILLVVVWLVYAMMGMNYYALILTFVAVFNSSGAMDIGVIEFDELERIAKDISG